MEIVLLIIMLLVGFSFILKLTCQPWAGRFASCIVAAVFILATYGAASTQSKTQIADWLSQPELMLDTSVWLTIDVAFQICFCILSAKSINSKLSPTGNALLQICRYVPGVMIFPVLFSLLTGLIFALPGVDFSLIAKILAGALIIVIPLLAAGMRYLIPEADIRLEMLFMTNMLVAALGIVVTVNGRTAAVGTNTIDWWALAGLVIILSAGLFTGLAYNKYTTRKTISKLK